MELEIRIKKDCPASLESDDDPIDFYAIIKEISSH
jgi:hypothetical protein